MAQKVERDEEINLVELIAAILGNFWLFLLPIALSGGLAVYYVLELAVREYEATTRFELNEADRSTGLGGLGGLASLSGVSIPGSSSEAAAMSDRILSRSFVEKIYVTAELDADPVFNGYIRSPSLSQKFKELLFGPTERIPPAKTELFATFVGVLKKRMALIEKDNGVIALRITHPRPERAAKIANTIVDQVLSDITTRKREASRRRLEYYAGELNEARGNLDAATIAVRDYAIKNNIQSADVLARTSVQLGQLRLDLNAVEKNYDAVAALMLLDADHFDAENFVETHEVSRSRSFRRLFNLNANTSDWPMPSNVDLNRARDDLMEQRQSLKNSIQALETQALYSGQQALELAKLEREVQVQQAVYESLIKQFESQSLFEGLETDRATILDVAIPPKIPARPQKSLIVALALVFGGLVGAMIATVHAKRGGAIYSKNAVERSFGKIGSFRLRSLDYEASSLKEISETDRALLRDIVVSLPKAVSQTAVIFPYFPRRTPMSILAGILGRIQKSDQNTGSRANKLLGLNFLQLLAATSASIGKKVAILNLSKFSAAHDANFETDSDGNRVKTLGNGVDIITPDNPNELLSVDVAEKTLLQLSSDYDQLFIVCPDSYVGMAETRVFVSIVDSAIIVASQGKVRRSDVKAINEAMVGTRVSDPILLLS